jgi:hypothetical protein
MTRSIGIQVVAIPLIAGLAGLPAIGQAAARQATGRIASQSATHISAVMVKGRLNPSASRPGDEVAIRLNEDTRSNGVVVIRKGTTITGVVKSVKRFESSGTVRGQAQSMMEIEWLPPHIEGRVSPRVMIALQSVLHTNPVDEHAQQSSETDTGLESHAYAAPGGAVLSAASSTATRTPSSNAALLSMPTVVAADSDTSSELQTAFGLSRDEQLFRTGHGEVLSTGGAKTSLDIFSYFANDTVLTSSSNNFEISSGAQMQLLVGVQK